MQKQWRMFIGAVLLVSALLATLPFVASAHTSSAQKVHAKHVLLLSIDGLHEEDLARYVALYPASTLATLSKHALTYTNAATSSPSDSFPGILSMTTGGTSRVTGVYYDDSYDRNLSAPGSNCSTKGTEVVYDESIDFDLTALNGGGGINPANLPLDPSKGCTPVYPHSFLRVNTIFEVAHEAGLHTAWSDKHPAYDLLNGPSGKGVDDLYSPEVAAIGPSVADTEAYDSLKVKVILNEIDGKDHSGTISTAVPALFGMNFQAVSVGEKTAGYLDAAATPTAPLANALSYVDQSIGAMVAELKKQDLFSSTVIIITAKHGQAPIDPTKKIIIDDKLIPAIVNSVAPKLLAQATEDDVALIWLNDATKTQAVVAQLEANKAQLHIKTILSGAKLAARFNSPLKDSRTPNIIVEPEEGVIYTSPTATKVAEHGGFSENDTHVGLLISNPSFGNEKITSWVNTTQIAPSILSLLGLDPDSLQAVQQEGTKNLPKL